MINKTTGGCNHLWLENILTGSSPRDLIFRMMASNGPPWPTMPPRSRRLGNTATRRVRPSSPI